MSNAIARTEQTSLTPIDGGMSAWRQMREEADVLVKSGFFPVDTAEKALAILMQGRELGLGPMQSMRMIDIIKGKPVINAGGMAALVQKYCATHGGYLRVAALDEEYCTIEYKRPEWPEPQRFTFTIEDAKAAQLTGNATWQKYPRNMLYARATSNACRMGWPEVIAGIYDPEELGGVVDVEHHIEPIISERVTVIESTGEIIELDAEFAERMIPATDRDKAIKRYFALLNERGITDDERKALQKLAYNVESSKDLSVPQIKGLTDRINDRSNEELRAAIAQSAPDRARATKQSDVDTQPFDPESATQQILDELQAATTQEEVQAIGRSAAAMGLHSPALAKATAEAFLRFRKDDGGRDGILDMDKPLKLA